MSSTQVITTSKNLCSGSDVQMTFSVGLGSANRYPRLGVWVRAQQRLGGNRSSRAGTGTGKKRPRRRGGGGGPKSLSASQVARLDRLRFEWDPEVSNSGGASTGAN